MDEFIKRLVTRRGFIDAFWQRFFERKNTGESVTQEDVYEELNDLYAAEFGEPAFVSFDAFRSVRRRLEKKDLEKL